MQRGDSCEPVSSETAFQHLAVALAAAVASGDVPAGLAGLARSALGPSKHLRCVQSARTTQRRCTAMPSGPFSWRRRTSVVLFAPSAQQPTLVFRLIAAHAVPQRVHVQRRRQHFPDDAQPSGHPRGGGGSVGSARRSVARLGPRHAGAAAPGSVPRRRGDSHRGDLHARAHASPQVSAGLSQLFCINMLDQPALNACASCPRHVRELGSHAAAASHRLSLQ